MTPQVQIWVHLDAGDNAASLAVNLQQLIRNVRQQDRKAFGFVIWIYGEDLKDEIAKLAQQQNITDIALCYLPEKERTEFLKRYKVETSWKLRNIVFIYRKKKLNAKFINLDAKDFQKVEKALQQIVQ